MDSETVINTADILLRQVPDVRIGNASAIKTHPVVKQELQFLRLSDTSQEKILDTLYSIHGADLILNDSSEYQNERSALDKRFWVGQGTLVVKGACDFSTNPSDNPTEEYDRLKQFALLRLESYGFHSSHCLEAFEYCGGNIEDSLYILYAKYLDIPYPFPKIETDLTHDDLMELRADEKSSLESIYDKSFNEKVRNSIWVLKFQLNYLINIYHNKNLELPKKHANKSNTKKKEKCRLFLRGTCKFGDKCRFSHEIEKEVAPDTEAHLKDFEFELEIRFNPNSQYPFEPPIIFLKTNAILPPLVNLHICKRLLEEANNLSRDGIPSIYTIAELLRNSEEITEFLKNEIDFPHPKTKLFDNRIKTKTKRKLSSHYRKGATNRDNSKIYSEQEILNENKRLFNKYHSRMYQLELSKMIQIRKKLPVWQFRNDVLNTIETSQVTIISGETGCGKSTQIPQFILDDWFAYYSDNSCDKKVNIVCTQPRRISAIGVAERVSQERIEKVGNLVGYQIRLETKMSESTRLLFCTTGILLRRLESDPLISNITHIVVDEVHERSEESDFLLSILKDLLPHRPDLKIILMSATLNAELFSNYFGNVPIIEIPGRTFHVEQIFLEDIFEMSSYVLEEGSEYSRKVKRGDDDDLEIQFETQIIREKPRDNLKDDFLNFAQLCARYEGCSKLTCKNLFLTDPEKINNDLIEKILEMIVSGEHDYPNIGTILVFLPGIGEITSLYDQLKVHPIFGKNARKFVLLPLHSSLTSEEQAAIFKKPKMGLRKVILSTNLAETSITIDDCVFVIDTGKMKEKHFDPNRNMESLETTWVTRANALQRKGRAGRVMSGFSFHLYTNHRFKHHLLAQPVPEIHRIPLERLVLTIKLLQTFENRDVKEVLDSFIEPPATENIESSISRLQDVGALDKNLELTALGQHLAALPLDVRIGKLILYGAIFSCVDAALTIAAYLSFKNPFVTPFDQKNAAQAKKLEFSTGFSDQITTYIAYKKWLQAHKKSSLAGRNFANENYLSLKTLISLADIKYQLLEYLVDIGFVSADLQGKRKMGCDNIIDSIGKEFNRNNENYRVLSSILCTALYPNIVKILTPSKSFIMSAAGAVPKEINAKELQFATNKEKIFIHPSSVNYKISNFPSPYLIYQEKVKTSRVFFRDCTMVQLISLVLFTGFDLDIKIHNGSTFISLENGWILLQVEEHKIAEMIKMIRMELCDILEEKIRDPLLNLQQNEKSSQVISTILHLISTT